MLLSKLKNYAIPIGVISSNYLFFFYIEYKYKYSKPNKVKN